jgi:CubicO group peptidase (beta-lactamase class C family)
MPAWLTALAQGVADLRVPGLSLAYQVEDGPVQCHTVGVADRQSGRPVEPDTLFQAGSVSKVVTAYAALALADAGLVDLDTDVNAYLSSWQVPPVADWQPMLTLRMLLAHAGGVHNGITPMLPREERPADLADVLRGRGGYPYPTVVEALPGVFWSYSGGGYLIIAQLVSDVVGAPFAEAARRLVFEPLGMASSTFAQPLPDAFVAHAARAHESAQPLAGGWYNFAAIGAVGLWTTPHDLVRLGSAIGTGAGIAKQMVVGHSVEPRMGLGVFLAGGPGHRWWAHAGSLPGYWCHIGGTVGGRDRFTLAVMANDADHANDLDLLYQKLAQSLGPARPPLNNLFAHSVAAKVRAAAGCELLAGTYVTSGGFALRLTVRQAKDPGLGIPLGTGVGLTLHLPGQAPLELLPITRHGWQAQGLGNAHVQFEPPDRLRLLQYGRQLTATRLRQSTVDD